MVNYAAIQQKIDSGLGKAGKKLGAPFAAYRVEASSNGDYPTGWTQVATTAPIWRIRVTEGKLPSALKASATVFWQIIGGLTGFELGDVFLNVDKPYVPGVSYGAGASFIGGSSLQIDAFAVAWHGPVEIPIGARLDRRAHILRPNMTPTATPDGTSIWRQTSDEALALTLVNGVFTFGAGPPSWVPVGLSSSERPPRGHNFDPGYPGVEDIPRYYAYVPYLPGYEPSEGDRLLTEDGAMYRVVNPYQQEAGFVGAQLSVDRMLSQNL